MSIKLSGEMQSVEEFCGGQGRGIRLPIYQRKFCWNKEEFFRFFQSIVEDITREDETECVTFMGCLICFEGAEKGIRKGTDPIQKVIDLVDGQQRITTILLLLTIIHDKLDELTSDNEWFRQQSATLRTNIQGVVNASRNGLKIPRAIREIQDSWPAKQKDPDYSSPVSSYIFSFLTQDSNGNGVHPNPKNQLTRHIQGLSLALEEFYQQNTEVANDLHHLGDVEKFLRNRKSKAFEAAFGPGILEDFIDKKFGLADGSEKDLMALLFTGNYVLKRVKFANIVISESYSQAMSIFDSINTTGQPLNALEALKSTVIKHVGVENYNRPDYKKFKGAIDETEERVAEMSGGDNRKKENSCVSDLIISFGMGNSGTQVEGNTLDQNKHLRKHFGIHSHSNDELVDFIRFLRNTSYMQSISAASDDGIRNFLREKIRKLNLRHLNEPLDQAGFCLRFLHRGGFTMPTAMLSVYLNAIPLDSSPEDAYGAISDFCSAVKSTAAFFAIWRSSHRSTNGVDGAVKRIMKGISPGGRGYSTAKMKSNALARYNYYEKSVNAPPPPKILSAVLKEHIVYQYSEICDARSWYSEAADVPLYSSARELVRFLLLVGSHNTKIDDGPKMTASTPGSAASFLNSLGYDDDLFDSIEHILPTRTNKKTGYVDIERDRLWNLTLVPKGANSSLSNRKWPVKRAMYGYYSAKTIPEKEESKIKLRKALKDDEAALQRFLKTNVDYGYLPMTEYLAKLEEPEFNKEVGEERVLTIFDNAWKILAEGWLGWSDNS